MVALMAPRVQHIQTLLRNHLADDYQKDTAQAVSFWYVRLSTDSDVT